MAPVVETIRTVPLNTEQVQYIPTMEVEDISGFPFDREGDRDGHFRSQLDDIAKRHPEFAEHLGNFSLRSSPRRQSSGGAEDADLHRRFERPFGGRFERFGFPFDRDDDFDPEQYAQQFHQPQQEFQQPQPHPHFQQQTSHQPQPSEYIPAQQPQQSPQPANTENPPPEPETRDRNIQQSNTIDLGQKQEPVNERNQRSMSAPPTEKGQRFTSSIKIPVNQPSESESESMPHTQPSDSKTTERIIPIHIEGRDEPVLPKNAPSSYSQPHQTFRTASPQPERIFGQRPEHFTQFVNREPRQYEKWHPQFEPMHHGFAPEEPVRQQRYQQQQNVPPHYQQQQQRQPQYQQQAPPQPKEEIPIPVQKDVPPTKQQAPQQEAAPPQPKPAAPQQQKPLTPIDQIQVIQKDVSELLAQVEQFAGQPKDKQYLYLDEMLTRNLLKLDNVDTQGQDNIRSARKEAIKCIERAIGVLEAKAAANVEPLKVQDKMEVEEKSPEPAAASEVKQNETLQPMETEPAVNAESKVDENQKQSMEVVPEPTNVASPPAAENEEESKPEAAETKVEDQVESVAVEAKVDEGAQQTEAPAIEEVKTETCEGQESNLPVAEAVKKFEGAAEKDDKKVDSSENKLEENKEASSQAEVKAEDKKEEKKEKKKGKKKAEKKEK